MQLQCVFDVCVLLLRFGHVLHLLHEVRIVVVDDPVENPAEKAKFRREGYNKLCT